PVGECLAIDLGHRSAEIHFLLGAVTHDDYFVQRRYIILEGNIDDGAVVDWNFLWHTAQQRKYKGAVAGCADAVNTVGIRCRGGTRTFHGHADTRSGCAILEHDFPGNGDGRLCMGEADAPHQDCDYEAVASPFC